MLRKYFFYILIGAFISTCCHPVFTTKGYCDNAKGEDVTFTTTDIDVPYKILGLVSYRSGTPDLDKVNEELKKQARKMKADYVVGIRYIDYAGYIFGYGTAVRVIKK